MKIKQTENIHPEPADTITVKMAGNVTELRFSKRPGGSPIKKIGKDHGVDVRTGELVEFRHSTSRASNKASVAQSLKRLRDIINANLENSDHSLWITLTYAINMRDEKQLYTDFHAFGNGSSGIKKGRDKPPPNILQPPSRRAGVPGTFIFFCFFLIRPRSFQTQRWRSFGGMALQR